MSNDTATTGPAPTPERLRFSVSEVAAATGMSDQTVYREVADGRLRAKKIRGRVVITPQALAEWLDSD